MRGRRDSMVHGTLNSDRKYKITQSRTTTKQWKLGDEAKAERRNRETHAQAFLATVAAISRLDRTDDFIVRIRRVMVRRVVQLGRHVD